MRRSIQVLVGLPNFALVGRVHGRVRWTIESCCELVEVRECSDDPVFVVVVVVEWHVFALEFSGTVVTSS